MTKRPAHLFLGSAGIGALPSWIASLPYRPERAALVPTAANRLPSAPFVESAADLLRAEGMHVERLDLEHAEEEAVEEILRSVRLVFVTGGHAIFLLQHVRESGFDRVVSGAVHRGDLAYVGISAGAALAGPDLAVFSDPEDPGVCKDLTGLRLVPFTVLPHRNRGRADRHDAYAARPGGQERFVSIDDDQAVTVKGRRRQIIESP